ncbi:MAG: hypothetical protein ACREMY_13000, partial [bacterium]
MILDLSDWGLPSPAFLTHDCATVAISMATANTANDRRSMDGPSLGPTGKIAAASFKRSSREQQLSYVVALRHPGMCLLRVAECVD